MTQPSTSRGWTVVLAALSINLILGVLYAWGVMGKALVGQWQWTKAEASLPFTVSTVSFALTMILAGRIQDRIGPRWVAMMGGLVLGLGLFASSVANTPGLMLITFGIVGGIGIGVGYCATTPPCIKWFPPARKGLITGIVVSGVGLAAVYMSPLTQYLVGKTSISATFVYLGIGTAVLVTLLAQFLANPPADYAPGTTGDPRLPPPSSQPGRNFDWHDMLRTPQFYHLWIMFVLAASAGLMIIMHVAIIAKEQAHLDKWGFLPIAILAIFNTVGRLVSGYLSDSIGRPKTLLLAFLLQGANMFAFSHYTTPAWLVFGSAFTGLCYGTLFTLFPATTADYYGLRNLGVNYGLMFTAFGVAGVIGPLCGGMMRDSFGTYRNSFFLSGSLLAVGAVLALFLKAPELAAETASGAPATKPSSAGQGAKH